MAACRLLLIPSVIFFTMGAVYLVCQTRAAMAEIYSFTDERGVIHFTNNPVDGRYVIIREEPQTLIEGNGKETPFDEHIHFFGGRYNVDPAFIKAVIKAESNFVPTVVSSAGAIGLMQLMPETAELMGVKNPYNPRDNIRGGVKYLSQLLKEFESRELAAAAYNSGENNVRKYGGIPPFDETRNFVVAVMKYFQDYSKVTFDRKKVYAVKRKDGVTVYTNRPWAYREGIQP
jgi:soluble lytic murein transglycosylase